MPESCLVLYYHRVGRPRPDPQLLAVSPENFEGHLRIIAEMADPVFLDAFAEGAAGLRTGRPAVAVTFDDGYMDNLELALPLLEKHSVPSMFYACTGFMDEGRELWWDELERLLLGPGSLPQELKLEFPDGPASISLGDFAEFPSREAQRHLDWDVTRATAPTPRHEAYRLLHKRLRPLGRAERDRVLGELAAMASADQSPRPDRRLLEEHALRTLDRSPCGRVGCHTVSHPVLSRVSLSEAREEIAQAKGRLESILGREVLDFSYPYGSSLDYDEGTQDILKELGFRTACTTVRGLARTGRELLALPRVGVRDLAEEDFRLLLEAELAGAGG